MSSLEKLIERVIARASVALRRQTRRIRRIPKGDGGFGGGLAGMAQAPNTNAITYNASPALFRNRR